MNIYSRNLRSRQLDPEHINYYKVRGYKGNLKSLKQIIKKLKSKKNEK